MSGEPSEANPAGEVLLSRSGESEPGGKLSFSRLDVPLNEELDSAISAMVVMGKYGSKAEYVRHVLRKELFGMIAVMRSKLPDQQRG